MEGIVMHDLHLEHMSHSFEVVCKSKQRRMKRKKLMLASGEEKTVTFFDRNETPLLYIVIDPDCDWIREINFTQSEQMYIYQANLENDAINQRAAIQVSLTLRNNRILNIKTIVILLIYVYIVKITTYTITNSYFYIYN